MVIVPILELRSPSSKSDLGLGRAEPCNNLQSAFCILLWPILPLFKITVQSKQELPYRELAAPSAGLPPHGHRSPHPARLRAWHGDGLLRAAAREGSIARPPASAGRWHPAVPSPRGSPAPGGSPGRPAPNISVRTYLEINFTSTFLF